MDKIVVCIKQVPDTCDIKWTKENNISREGMLSILNPADKSALLYAKKIKEVTGAKVIGISMGPYQAKEVLEFALALCCDEAYLLSDKIFSASDTLATGNILSSGIEKIAPDFDLILCGQYALDGDTAQTGPTLANLLNIPCIPYALDLVYENSNIIIKQEAEDGLNILKTQERALICVQEKEEETSIKIEDYILAQDKEIKILDNDFLGIDKEKCGILGSPTFVSNVFRKQANRKCEILDNISPDVLLNKINAMRKNV